MIAALSAALGLSPQALGTLALIAFAAGLVRGFTGFALSAFALALGVLILPPVALVPVLWWLELGASFLLLRRGWAEAEVGTALMLVAGSALGLAVGLAVTTRIDPALSRRIALSLLIVLAVLQLARLRIGWLASRAGTLATGVLAGLATGLAGVGGMVVALYILSRQMPPARMRGTLIVYLMFGSVASLLLFVWYGTMTGEAVLRGLVLTPPALLGAYLGQRLFVPRLAPFYRPACLSLLIGLGGLSLLRSLA